MDSWGFAVFEAEAAACPGAQTQPVQHVSPGAASEQEQSRLLWTLHRCVSGQDATDLCQERLCQGILPLCDPSRFGIIIPNNRIISQITDDL